MSIKTRRVAGLALLFACAILARGLTAEELRLSLGLERPVLAAGERQLTYMKVGLTGFEMSDKKGRVALNVALVLDRSGSMEGEKLQRAKEAAKYAVELMSGDDVLSIVTYESEVQILLPATRVMDKDRIIRMIDRIETDGSTALFAGVSTGASEVRRYISKNRVNRVILLSDGLANVGPSNPSELAELGRSLGREGISVTTIGLGLDYNEDLMARLASSSDGNHAFVQEPRDLARVFDLEFKDALSVVARDVILELNCAPGVTPKRVLNREAEIRGQQVRLNMNQIHSQQEKYILLEVEVASLKPGQSQAAASATARYQNLQTNKAASVAASANVRGTNDLREVELNLNKPVAAAVAVQQAALESERAVKLRDEGKLEEAKQVLQESASRLNAAAGSLAAPALNDLAEQNAQAAEKLDDEEDWQRQRKAMVDDNYATQTQQTY